MTKHTEIKIKTPYGNKNWSFVKKCFDCHEELLEACKEALHDANNPYHPYKITDDAILKLNQAISKAEGK